MAKIAAILGQLLWYIFLVSEASISTDKSWPPTLFHGVDLPTTRPLNIAHRGSSGQLPEHTVEAYELAIRQGADIIECDLAVTKDKQLICAHESWLSVTTDVASRKEFADRRTSHTIEGKPVQNDWFSVDFTLQELKTLRLVQRFTFRDPSYNGRFKIATLEEYIEVAKNANRPIGIYPETKSPEWVNSLGIMNGTRFEDLLLTALKKHGYTEETDACFVQSFSYESLAYMANHTKLPLIMLLRNGSPIANRDLERYAKICYGVGPYKGFIVPQDANGKLEPVTDFVKRSNALGLRVHVSTFRNEDRYLAWDYGQDAKKELDLFIQQRIDGVFTDFPETFYSYLNHTYFDNCLRRSASAPTVQTLNSTFLSLIAIAALVIK